MRKIMPRAGYLMLALMIPSMVLTGCQGGPMNTPEKISKAPRVAYQWALLNEHAPNILWESGLTWHPETQRVVWHGGHIGRLFPQSNYTFLYDPDENRFFESQAPTRPQRRCLIHVAYVDSCSGVVTMDGSVGHGSISGGTLSGDYRHLRSGHPAGPWLYNPMADTWEDCRTLPPLWPRTAHAPIAYEPGSDAVFSLRGSRLVIFIPRLNRVFTRPLPPALHSRLGYGMTVDPIRRRLVVFGGSAGGGYQWVRPTEGQTREEARHAAYEKMVKADTWLYDIASDTWREADVPQTERPPRGLPMTGMRSLQLVWHEASESVLLMVDSVNDTKTAHPKWPPAELWRFDPVAERWSSIETHPDASGRQPAIAGLITVDQQDNRLIVIGGGLDGTLGDKDAPIRSGSSRLVWSLPLRDRTSVNASASPQRIVATTSTEAVTVEWPTEAGQRYDVYRAPAGPLPGTYTKLTSHPVTSGRFKDNEVDPGKAVAYRVAAVGSDRPSLPAFNQPWRPSGLLVSVESEKEVRLEWSPVDAPDIVGYQVYRARGSQLEKAEGALLNKTPLGESRFTDRSVNLADGVIHGYWVTAVNRAGMESGASPLAYTVPDAPTSLTVPEGVGPSTGIGERIFYTVSWMWPSQANIVGFNLYGAKEIIDTHLVRTKFEDIWTKLNETPLTATEHHYPLGDKDKGHRYFFVRAVNTLGQEGFATDIVSPTDRRFRP